MFGSNGKIKVSNTIEARFALIFEQILPEIGRTLFGQRRTRKHEQ